MPLTQVNPGLLDTQAQYTGFKNRIINGAMMIDQRNAGASVTIGPSLGGAVYTLDRWFGFASSTRTFTVQRSTLAPAGYINSALLTVGVSGSPAASEQILFGQNIEGLNVADLGWGTANAQPVAVSFWVRSSITGTYGCAIHNNNGSRCYPTTYTINSANTWEYKTLVIPGDTSGTWLTTNGIGLNLRFDLGSGSNYNGTADAWTGSFVWRTSSCVNWIANAGATLYFTGVQLEKGTTATSFDYRPYGTELALCQRYYEKSYSQSVVPGTASTPGSILVGAPTTGLTGTTGYIIGIAKFTVVKRVAPTTILLYDEAGTVNAVTAQAIGVSSTNGNAFYIGGISDTSFQGGRDGITGTRTSAQAASFHYTASAEL